MVNYGLKWLYYNGLTPPATGTSTIQHYGHADMDLLTVKLQGPAGLSTSRGIRGMNQLTNEAFNININVK